MPNRRLYLQKSGIVISHGVVPCFFVMRVWLGVTLPTDGTLVGYLKGSFQAVSDSYRHEQASANRPATPYQGIGGGSAPAGSADGDVPRT